MAKAVLLGLDGATFSQLDPLVESGRLPNLGRLMTEGVRGSLLSTIHPLTPAAWTSCVTGLNPGKHGIYDFRRRRYGSYDMDLVNARRRDGVPVWNILSERGLRAGVFNVPMTYPPDRVNGFVVGGMDTPGIHSNFVWPPALRDSLLEAVPDFRIDLDTAPDDESQFLAHVEELNASHQRALSFLIEEHRDLDFLMAVFVTPDRLYHAFWRELDPAHPAHREKRARAVRQAHERLMRGLDDSVGELVAWAGDKATIIVMSDHGFGPLEKDVYMNRFLLDAGLLTFRKAVREDGPFPDMVDWSRTRAYSFGFFGNINLNLRGREPQGIVEQGREAEELKALLIQELRNLKDPESGEPIVDAVYRREELYWGPHVEEAPDLLIVMRNYAYMTRDGYEGVRHALVGPPMSLSKQRLLHTGNHRPDGILIMAGPGVRRGGEVERASIMDIAPTVLHVLGVPAPGIMDGRVVRQAFTEEHLRQHPPRRIVSPPPAPQSNAWEERLLRLKQQVSDLETRAARLETERDEAKATARQLHAVIADKNQHIGELKNVIRQREETLSRYQQSIFFRAYQRWQRWRGKRA